MSNPVRLSPPLCLQARKIEERDRKIRAEHLRLKTEVPPSSLDPNDPSVDAVKVRQKRLVYRSKQRGWLEVDLLLGSWAAENVTSLSNEEMDQYEAILNLETIDIFNVINGSQEPPPDADNAILQRLKEYANNSPFGKASSQTYEQVKDRTGLI